MCADCEVKQQLIDILFADEAAARHGLHAIAAALLLSDALGDDHRAWPGQLLAAVEARERIHYDMWMALALMRGLARDKRAASQALSLCRAEVRRLRLENARLWAQQPL